ncbi:hypothetical protein Bca101_023790 [Brassica carinata]
MCRLVFQIRKERGACGGGERLGAWVAQDLVTRRVDFEVVVGSSMALLKGWKVAASVGHLKPRHQREGLLHKMSSGSQRHDVYAGMWVLVISQLAFLGDVWSSSCWILVGNAGGDDIHVPCKVSKLWFLVIRNLLTGRMHHFDVEAVGHVLKSNHLAPIAMVLKGLLS